MGGFPHYKYIPGIDEISKLPVWFYTDEWLIFSTCFCAALSIAFLVGVIHLTLVTTLTDSITSTHIVLFIQAFGLALLYGGLFHTTFDQHYGYCALFLGTHLVLSGQVLLGTVTIKSINKAPRITMTSRCCSKASLQKLHRLNIRYILSIGIPLLFCGLILVILYEVLNKSELRKICDIYNLFVGCAGMCVTIIGIVSTRNIQLPFSWFVKMTPAIFIFVFWIDQLVLNWVLPNTDTRTIILELTGLAIAFLGTLIGGVQVIKSLLKK